MKASKISRVLLVLLNALLFLFGVLLFVGGLLLDLESGFLSSEVVVLLNNIEYNAVKMGYLLEALAYIMMATGGLVCVFAVIGIFGSLKKIRCCLVVYIFFTVFFIIVEVVLIGLWVHYRSRMDEWMEGKMLTLLSKYTGPQSTDDISVGWNLLFMDGHCCGVNDQYDGGSNNDFIDQSSVWHSAIGAATDKVPATCCQGVSTSSTASFVNSAKCTQGPTNYYSQGCYSWLRKIVYISSLLIFIVLGIAIIIQVINILLSCVLTDDLKKRVRHSGQIVTSSSKGKANPPPYLGIDAVLKTGRGKR